MKEGWGGKGWGRPRTAELGMGSGRQLGAGVWRPLIVRRCSRFLMVSFLIQHHAINLP